MKVATYNVVTNPYPQPNIHVSWLSAQIRNFNTMLVIWVVTPCRYHRLGGTHSLHIYTWRWDNYIPPKHWYLSTSPHWVTTRKTTIYTSVQTSDPIYLKGAQNPHIDVISYSLVQFYCNERLYIPVKNRFRITKTINIDIIIGLHNQRLCKHFWKPSYCAQFSLMLCQAMWGEWIAYYTSPDNIFKVESTVVVIDEYQHTKNVWPVTVWGMCVLDMFKFYGFFCGYKTVIANLIIRVQLFYFPLNFVRLTNPSWYFVKWEFFNVKGS